ncbi:MAG: hypothetical protein JW699_00780 [Chitinispirillaceae bacterium]|nr:hypothetical protein [Chitinispirillaceae bacterium]
MEKITKAENDKIAVTDFTTAAETTAEGIKRTAIRNAEEIISHARVLHVEGKDEATRLMYESAGRYFVGKSQLIKKLEMAKIVHKNNAKSIVEANHQFVNVICDLAGIAP